MIQLPFDIELMNGKGVPRKFHIRRAGPEDLDAVMELQQTIVDALPDEEKDIYATYTREESLDLTMVRPEYRGHGLQRLFNKIRIGQAIELGATEGLTSISPSNPYSYNNFLIVNFEIADRRPLYGGKDRYLLRKEFFKTPEKKPNLL